MTTDKYGARALKRAKAALTGCWTADVNMLAGECDRLKSLNADNARSELRRMIIRVMEYELLSHVLIKPVCHEIFGDYTSYVLDSGSMPVSREALELFLEQVGKGVKGDSHAAYLLGTGYLSGVFGRICYKLTHLWYHLAAEKGHPQAQFNLGVCYQNGEGVEQSYERALEWFERSAALGFDKAMINIGLYYSNGWLACGQNHAKARVYYEKAAARGSALGMYHLSLCYLNGDGTPPDEDLGLRWLTASARAGFRPALELLESAHAGPEAYH